MPAVTDILDKIHSRLEGITTDNGYNYTVRKITRAKLTPFKGYDLPAINYWCTTTANERNSYGNDLRQIELFIEMYENTRDNPFIDVVDLLAEDVVTSVVRSVSSPAVSASPNYDLDETIQELVLNGWDYIVGEGQKPFCGALVNFSCLYTTDSFDMSNFSI